ncbi:MAG: hypothetical protein AAGJ81_11965 [Verrucomicrobiota bacterium]
MILTILGVSVGSLVQGQTAPIESLINRSPFLPPGYRTTPVQPPKPVSPPVAAAASRFELVGVSTNNGVVSVSLRRLGEPRGTWLTPGDRVDDVKFVRFHLAAREAVVEVAGRRETIPLKPPSISAMPPPNPAANQRPPQTPVANNQVLPSPPTGNQNAARIPVRRRVIVPTE